MTPSVYLAGGRALYIGPGLDLAPHRNAAATVAIALEAPFSLGADEQGPHASHHAALIAPGTWHHLRARGPMAFLYLDPASDDVAALRVPEQIAWPAAPASGAEAHIAGVLQAVGVRPRRSARLRRTLAALDTDPQRFARIEDAAAHAGLSASRFGHVFRAEVGLPFRRYRIWRRMAAVARALQSGRSLTEAACEAGFSSSAHFSATFRQLFGLPPSVLVRLGTRFIVDDASGGTP